jgi:general secretion pathway protein C
MRFALSGWMVRRSIVPVVVVSLGVCAWLHARGFSALLGAGLATPALDPVPAAQAAVEPPRAPSADVILARNPFDSVTGPLIEPPVPGPPGAGAEPSDGPCEGVRVASIVASTDPDWSLVMLEVRGERGPILRRRGGDILAIGLDRVLLERDGKRCVARIFSSAAGTAASASAATPPPASARGVQRTGPGSFVIDRGARDALIDGATDLMHAVAVRPEKVGDDVIGLRLAVLRPGTPLEALGVRAGDVLQSLNDIPLTSPDRMLEAYARVRTADHVRVVLLREGRQLQLDYDVR